MELLPFLMVHSPQQAASTNPFFFLFLGPLITPVRVRGETRGHCSSSSQNPFTLTRIHSLVMVVG